MVSTATPKWEAHAITFTVTSKGMTGPGYIADEHFLSGVDAEKMLCSRQFEPTTGVITRVMVLRGPAFIAAMRYPPNLRNYAYARGLLLPRMEVGALIARKFDHADLNAMGIKQIRVMHTPWVTEFGESTFESTLTVGFHMSGSRGEEWLHGILLQPHMPFMKSETEFCGFAFEIPD